VRRLIASEFVTLDGVMEAPGHEPHPDGRNAWALRHAGEDQQRFKVDEVFQAGAILLGRVTYEIFAAFWPTAPKDEGFADRMNDIPKYVVSKTLESPSWRNSTVVRGDPVEAITDLKQELGGDIFLYGSCGLPGPPRKRQAPVQGSERHDAPGALRDEDVRVGSQRADLPPGGSGAVEQVRGEFRLDR
jgi:dihydrofolate reductase